MSLMQADEKVPIFPRLFSSGEDDPDLAHKITSRPAQPVHPDAITVDAVSTFEVLKTCTPSLILMDIQLPEVDGWEVTRRLKADAATTHIPVIAITAYGEAGDDRRARQAGFVDFLSKPVSTRDLPRIVHRHLGGH